MGADELETALNRLRDTHRAVDEAEERVEVARRELRTAEEVATAHLRLLQLAGDLDRTVINKLYWADDGLKPAAIAAAVGLRPERLHEAVAPLIVEATCCDCGGQAIAVYRSRAARDAERPDEPPRCERCAKS